MWKRFFCGLAILMLLVPLSGCATQRKKDLEIQGLRNQLSALESQLQTKDEEISYLKASWDKTPKVAPEVKLRPGIRQIQIALRNAGYNPGPIDARKGRQTKDAIKAFQRANNLAVDGKVGKQTWNLLKEYLYKKVK